MKKVQNTDNRKNTFYGIVGMIALFLVGVLVGFIINGSDRINHSSMSRQDCDNIAVRIMNAARDNHPDLIEQLNKVYSENCLNREFEQPKPQPKAEDKKLPNATCAKIETLLERQLTDVQSMNSYDHIRNAQIYANLSERGCADNSAKYKELAKQEIDIARALNDDNLEDRHESIEIVETYKRLKMQQEAEKMIEKAKKLTNPAIDFIIQLEKIIEED